VFFEETKARDNLLSLEFERPYEIVKIALRKPTGKENAERKNIINTVS
jgi:hypothetical protein